MISKIAAWLALLAALALGSSCAAGQAAAARSRQTPLVSQTVSQAPPPSTSSIPSASSTPAAPAAIPAPSADCLGDNCDLQPSHIAIATPAPAPAPWLLQDRIAWAANLLLVLLAYVAILLALSTLRKIERQTRYAETTATAAAESAQAALLHAQSVVRAKRPWVLMSVRPSPSIENGFAVVATNRGRGPARILSTVDEVVSAIDETRLAASPDYRNKPAPPAEPIVLLSGESAEIAFFSRADVPKFCLTQDQLKRVENWEDKIFLQGSVVYEDLGAPQNAPAHESSWCAWYIHGRQKSGMVMAGPPAYNRHT